MVGIAAVADIAVVSDLDPNPNHAVPLIEGFTTNLLRAAEKVGAVRYVLCTNTTVCCQLVPGSKIHVTEDSWDDGAIERAWAPPPYRPERLLDVIATGKIRAERAMRKFCWEQGAGSQLVANSVAAGLILGAPVHESHMGHMVSWIRDVYMGGKPMMLIPVGESGSVFPFQQ